MACVLFLRVEEWEKEVQLPLAAQPAQQSE
jgi:hypothetical protein